jgi:hypothetical protein
MLTLHWRMRDFGLRPRHMNLREFVEKARWGPLDLSFAELVDDDLAIRGVAIEKAGEDFVGMVTSVAMERHLAANWLTNEQARYSRTDTST